MQVGMMEQVLAPSVKYGEKADLGTQVFGDQILTLTCAIKY